jgi:hypothetical protein
MVAACSSLRDWGSISLFNGKNLDGWTAVSQDPSLPANAVWSVRDGILVCKGEPLGYLASNRKFTNCQVELDYRWAPGQKPGNSGIFFRVNGPTRALPRCIEVQLQHGNAGDIMGLQGMPLRGPADRFQTVANHAVAGDIAIVKRSEGAEKPAGEWNHVKVVVQGNDVRVWFNGRQINEATGAPILAGPVGLQSEGGEVQFRNVRLTPLR